VFQGSEKALAANDGDGRHLHHQRGEGQSHLVKKGLEEALTEDGGRRQRQLESGGSVDSESGGSCGAPVGWSRREARGGGVSAACTGRKRKKEKGGGVRWRPGGALLKRHGGGGGRVGGGCHAVGGGMRGVWRGDRVALSAGGRGRVPARTGEAGG
jgi:hypothetical protein